VDERQTYGFVTALGRALANVEGRDAVKELREAGDAGRLAALARDAPHNLPAERVEDFIATTMTPARWEKTRAQLILAVQLARGDIARQPGHEKKGAGGVRGRP